MGSSAFNMIDLSILVILGFSIVVGVLRGATREVLGIAAWVGAFVIVFYGLPLLRPLGRHYIETPMIADAIVAGLLFLLSLAVFILISRSLSTRIKGSMLSGLDRSLGLVFGFIRGIFVICLIYLAMGFFYPSHTTPEAVKSARLTHFVAQGTQELKRLIPEEYLPKDLSQPTAISPLDAKDLLENSLPTLEATVKNLSTLKPTSPKKSIPQYDEQEKRGLEILIEKNDATPQE